MKPSMLGLLIAAVAFGASSVYLGVQLNEERLKADQILEESRVLSARIASLEKARAELEALRAVSPEPLPVPAGMPGVPPREVLADARPASDQPVAGADTRNFRPGPPPERSEAFQKMVRSQIRGNYKRLYADLGAKLGLGQEEANKLIDLITDQQVTMMDRMRQERGNGQAPADRVATMEKIQQENLAQITNLIGGDKIELYKQYQDTLPARQEVEMLSRQLEGNDAGLSKDQHDRMVTALAEERGRVPAPKLADSGSPEEYSKAMSEWQEDYNERSATRARSILSGDQLAAYNEYQQWSREMRQNFESRRGGRAGAATPVKD
jgi:hypothetical protein